MFMTAEVFFSWKLSSSCKCSFELIVDRKEIKSKAGFCLISLFNDDKNILSYMDFIQMKVLTKNGTLNEKEKNSATNRLKGV